MHHLIICEVYLYSTAYLNMTVFSYASKYITPQTLEHTDLPFQIETFNLSKTSRRPFNMAERFLAQLPRVTKGELPEDNTCIICHEEYGVAPSDSEPAEDAVRLPCPGQHIVGLDCISSWFIDTYRSTCPYCRYEFPALTVTAPPRELALRVPDDERHQRWSRHCLDILQVVHQLSGGSALAQRWEQWFMEWYVASRGDHPPSEEQRSRARTVRSNLYARTGWSELPADTEMVRWSETGSSAEIRPVVFRTRFYREYFYCLRNGRVDAAMRGPQAQLTNEQKTCIYTHLCQIGAFRGALEDVESLDERWRILRSQGLTFNAERRQWSAYLY